MTATHRSRIFLVLIGPSDYIGVPEVEDEKHSSHTAEPHRRMDEPEVTSIVDTMSTVLEAPVASCSIQQTRRIYPSHTTTTRWESFSEQQGVIEYVREVGGGCSAVFATLTPSPC